MFDIEMLPAREGDCLWIRYGDKKNPRQILIDGGRAATAKELKARLALLPEAQKTFELLIVSHVDRDHIEGILSLIKDAKLSLRFKDIWFNGYHHLQDASLESFGAVQGEQLSRAFIEGQLPWNRQWKSKAACLDQKKLKVARLAGDLKLTLFSPDREKLTKLIPVWEKECKKAGLVRKADARPSEAKGFEQFGGIDIEKLAVSPFTKDHGEPNGSSIAVLAEYKGKKVLLAADAHADRIIDSIKLFKKSARKLKLDAFKVAHHGSEHNISEELMKLVDCKRYLISTNGSYFKHPTPSALARILKFGGRNATVFFNYKTKYTLPWDSSAWRKKYGYNVVYPPTKENGSLTVSL